MINQTDRAIKIIAILRQASKNMVKPATVSLIERYGRNPYLILVGCLLSLRTKDSVSLPAALRLFEHAITPRLMVSLPLNTIMELIYPVGFYRKKATLLHTISQKLIQNFGGNVPHTKEELLSLPGVGQKTANLVLSQGFNIPAICVDTHVHRIANRLGLVQSTRPQETEEQLKKILPQEYWSEFNTLLVMWGQNICTPRSPHCSTCPIFSLCPKKGVTHSR
ncbi:endonuclease III [Candidatus Dependentiae bacterium]|nr:endonuclease III [Candidatus Dependentiae bacterium]